jgi:hypothetical protein
MSLRLMLSFVITPLLILSVLPHRGHDQEDWLQAILEITI